MDFEFDFRLHADVSTLVGTQYFELAPGACQGHHWVSGSRSIDEYTFSLIEGIFEERIRKYDDCGCVEVPRSQWKLILGDIATLRSALTETRGTTKVALPYGGKWRAIPLRSIDGRSREDFHRRHACTPRPRSGRRWRTLRGVQASFEEDLAANQRPLASLLFALEQWLSETLAMNEAVSVLGL
jgi:hypothetical protein